MIEVFLTDPHFPFHDKAVWDSIVGFIKDVQPDLIFFGGDTLDNYSLSRFDKQPERLLSLPKDVKIARKELQRVRDAAPNARLVVKEGNHDERLVRYLNNTAPALKGMEGMSVPEMLNLKAIEGEWVDNFQRYKVGKLWHLHGNELNLGGGINVARTMFLKTYCNTIFGHFHKNQTHTARCYDGGTVGAFAVGCIARLDPDYAHFPQWNQGFAVIQYVKSGEFQVEQIQINKTDKGKARFIWQGKTYESP